jgi:anti-repressor protein
MNNNITIFDFAPGISLRSINRDGEPWFLVSDVCQALGIGNPSQAAQKLDEDEKALTSMNTPGGRQQTLIVDESGLNTLVLRSRKPEAKAFRKWVTKTVLPALRRDGVYIVGQEKPITDADTLPALLEQAARIQAKVHAIHVDMLRRWHRHDEEKHARREGWRLLRGKAPKACEAIAAPHQQQRN